ncbi:MAG: T9SS type A sorting domain-containing protein, partial [candidate division Zixibacteria bacterium]|nr:T9SS type A sorting domain-containing protein [candidate division Zixibacteria bacterium]
SVQQTTDGGYIIAGETGSYGAGNRDSYLIKTDSSGDTLWTQTYGGASHDIAESVQQTTDGGYILGGYTESYGAGNRDFYLIKTDSSGDTLWTRTYGGAAYDYAESVQQTTDGGYIMTGYTSSFGAGGADCYLIKTDSSGDTLWTRTYGGAIYDMAYSVQQTTDGGYIVAGGTNSFGPGSADFYLVKVEGAPYYLDLSYVPDDFIFQVTGDSTVLRTFEVYSVGVTGYVKPLCDSSWVSFDPDSVEISHGDTVTFTATFDATGMDYNVTYETEIHFESNVIDLEDDSIHVEMTTNQPIPITIGMIPDNPPVVVAPGDSFTYEGILHNNFGGFFDYPDPITVWINVEHRNIIIGPIHRFNDLTVGPRGESYPAIQYVHSEAVPGEYGYIAYCSPNYPEIMDSCYFTVTITEGSGNFNRSWELYGWGEDISGFENLPAQFALMQNYPNPFNATTTISFDIVQSGNVNLSVYNLAGQKIESLVDGRIEAGEHSITWDASTYSSGVYFYKLTSEGQTFTKRMTLMK